MAQRPDMILAVEWDVKYLFKQTNKQNCISIQQNYDEMASPLQKSYIKIEDCVHMHKIHLGAKIHPGAILICTTSKVGANLHPGVFLHQSVFS